MQKMQRKKTKKKQTTTTTTTTRKKHNFGPILPFAHFGAKQNFLQTQPILITALIYSTLKSSLKQ